MINGLNGESVRRAGGDLRKAILDSWDDRKGVLPKGLNCNPGNDLSFPVEFGDATPLIGREFDTGHILQQNRHAAVGLDDNLLQVGDVLHIAAPTYGKLCFGQLNRPTANIAIARAQSGPNFIYRYS